MGSLEEQEKYPWVLDMDISKFFDTIDHDLLMKAGRKHTEEKWVLLYIERCADDTICHCVSEEQAQFLKSVIVKRFEKCGLKLNEEKTMIVYCKDSNRRRDSEHTSLDFLGFTFGPRGARNRKTGQNFTAFLPAMSKKSMMKIKETVRSWKLNCKTYACLLGISNEVDAQISGWMNYYMKFGRSEFRKVLNYINERLTRWVTRKYKRFSKGKKLGKAYD